MKKRDDLLTVDKMINLLTNLKDSGKGGYTVGCNDEYVLFNDISPRIDDDETHINFSAGR